MVLVLLLLSSSSGICATHHCFTMRAIPTSFGNTIVALLTFCYTALFLFIPSASLFYIIWSLSYCRGNAAFPDFVRIKISMYFFEICLKIVFVFGFFRSVLAAIECISSWGRCMYLNIFLSRFSDQKFDISSSGLSRNNSITHFCFF